MKHGIYCLIVLATVALCVTAARADYINLPVKYSQTPWDTAGMDWHSMHPHGVVVADDFTCTDPDPIVAVRWWGSYMDCSTVRPTGFTGPFDISFHLSIPGSAAPHPFSTPGPLVYFATVTAQEQHVGFDNWAEAVYRYDAYLPVPFQQYQYSRNSGIVGELWIDIDKVSDELDQHWGWAEVVPPHPRLDFAVFGPTHAGPWTHLNTDMAFELMTVPEPATLMLVGTGALGFLRYIRRQRKK